MKKFIAGFIAGSLIFGSVGAYAATSTIKLIVNGQQVDTDVPPQVVNGRTLVPLRTVAESLGLYVAWDASQRAVIVNSPTDTPTDLPVINSINGTWNSSINGNLTNTITFDQEGNKVSATYYNGGGIILGTLEGSILKGNFYNLTENSSGTIEFEFSSDFLSFTGNWQNSDDSSIKGTWSGTKTP